MRLVKSAQRDHSIFLSITFLQKLHLYIVFTTPFTIIIIFLKIIGYIVIGLVNLSIYHPSIVLSILGGCLQVQCKISKGAKLRNRYNQVPHLTQDINGKVTDSQLDTTNESQEVSSFPAGDHKAHLNRRVQRHNKQKTEKKHKKSTEEIPPWNGQKNILLEDLNLFDDAPTSPLVQMWIKTHRCLICMKDP